MIAELLPAVDPEIARHFGTVPDDSRVGRAAAFQGNGISFPTAANSAEAKRIVLGLIPDGSQVHHRAGAEEALQAHDQPLGDAVLPVVRVR